MQFLRKQRAIINLDEIANGVISEYAKYCWNFDNDGKQKTPKHPLLLAKAHYKVQNREILVGEIKNILRENFQVFFDLKINSVILINGILEQLKQDELNYTTQITKATGKVLYDGQCVSYVPNTTVRVPEKSENLTRGFGFNLGSATVVIADPDIYDFVADSSGIIQERLEKYLQGQYEKFLINPSILKVSAFDVRKRTELVISTEMIKNSCRMVVNKLQVEVNASIKALDDGDAVALKLTV